MCMTSRPSELTAVLPGLLGLDHVGIAVTDLETAIPFYRDMLGLQVVHREDNLDQQVAEVMLTTTGTGLTGYQLQLVMRPDMLPPAGLGEDSSAGKSGPSGRNGGNSSDAQELEIDGDATVLVSPSDLAGEGAKSK